MDLFLNFIPSLKWNKIIIFKLSLELIDFLCISGESDCCEYLQLFYVVKSKIYQNELVGVKFKFYKWFTIYILALQLKSARGILNKRLYKIKLDYIK